MIIHGQKLGTFNHIENIYTNQSYVIDVNNNSIIAYNIIEAYAVNPKLTAAETLTT